MSNKFVIMYEVASGELEVIGPFADKATAEAWWRWAGEHGVGRQSGNDPIVKSLTKPARCFVSRFPRPLR